MAADSEEINKTQLKRFLMFTKSKRDRHLRELDLLLDDAKQDHCSESIFNQSDVLSLLDEYHSTIKDLTRSEYDTISRMSAIYASTLYEQATNQLMGDLAVLEDEYRLQRMADLEEECVKEGFSMNSVNLASMGLGSANLGNMGGSGSGDNTNQNLVQENQMLNERYLLMQKQCSELLKERSNLSSELSNLKQQFSTAINSDDQNNNNTLIQLEKQLSQARNQLDSRSSEMEKVKEDLNKRLIDSKQFQDLKLILLKKNTLIKDLREKLKACGVTDDGSVGEGVIIEQ